MTQRIREAMKREPLAGLLTGTIVADETYIGGKPKNRHGGMKSVWSRGGERAPDNKTPVLSLIHRETGEVRSQVLPRVDGANLRRAIAEHVNMGESHLETDELVAYRKIGPEFRSHEAVYHSGHEYVRGTVTTNAAEGYFSQLKRSLDGTHHRVSVEHLPRYLAEFDFRYSTRDLSDTRRMERLMGQVAGRRLTYRPLTGKP